MNVNEMNEKLHSSQKLVEMGFCDYKNVNLSISFKFAPSCQVIDLLVLFILHSTNANQSRRGAEKLLKVKVRSGLIQEALLQRTFRDYAQVC